MKLSRQQPQEPAKQAETPTVGQAVQKVAHSLPDAFSVRGLATMMSVAFGATAVPDYDQPVVDLGIEVSVRLIDTPAFKAWFGDSKVVDDQGNPLPVYHGTRRAFDRFVPSSPRGGVGNPKGSYFTPDKRAAEEHARDCDGAWDSKSRVIEAYLRITNDEDGSIINSLYRGTEFVVFDPDAILISQQYSLPDG